MEPQRAFARPRRTLVPVVDFLDGSRGISNERPSSRDEGTRHPAFPWDLRTLILVFPPGSRFRFLNLNITLGLTGTPFDQAARWGRADPREAFDLQFCLQGEGEAVTRKACFTASRDLEYRQGVVHFRIADTLDFRGRWPHYLVGYRQPDRDLELTLEIDSRPGIQWWYRAPRLYCHYTSFCTCRMTWRLHGESGTLTEPLLHDHGWARNLLPLLRVPLRVFRYEVLRLSGDGHAISLWTEGPGRLQMRNVGVTRTEADLAPRARGYTCRVLEWETFPNYAGLPCRVPARWLGVQEGDGTRFEYEAVRETTPHPILGEGFLYGFRYAGHIEGGATDPGRRHVEGNGYVEHLGRFIGRS